ncbi:hypothetical protein PP1Y_AT10361 [Novosphingobium sp. PP1Y]|nr:hypothetical protein PP1Y_AT10361 [Novosphingobium sp. PP1Y]
MQKQDYRVLDREVRPRIAGDLRQLRRKIFAEIGNRRQGDFRIPCHLYAVWREQAGFLDRAVGDRGQLVIFAKGLPTGIGQRGYLVEPFPGTLVAVIHNCLLAERSVRSPV